MLNKSKCQIECVNCKKKFPSPIQFEDPTSFFESYLMGYTIQCPSCKEMTVIDKENIFFDMEMVEKDREEKIKRDKITLKYKIKAFFHDLLATIIISPILVIIWLQEKIPRKIQSIFFSEALSTIFYVNYRFNGNYYGVYYTREWLLAIPFVLPVIAFTLSLIADRISHESIKTKIKGFEMFLWLSDLGIMMGLYGSKESYA